MVVPVRQAEELEAIVTFLEEKTKKNEVVFMYPEMGLYNFLADRPFLGRFPMATFSWFNDHWHKELVQQFKNEKPRHVILPQKLTAVWDKVYFARQENRAKYDEVMSIIHDRYILEAVTPESYIYKIKNDLVKL